MNEPLTVSVRITIRFWVKPMLYAAQAFAFMFMLDDEGREQLANGLIEFIMKYGVKTVVC